LDNIVLDGAKPSEEGSGGDPLNLAVTLMWER
jgi:hypothetical protein